MKAIKRLVVLFLGFVACLQGLQQVPLIPLLVGVAVGMACMALLHILFRPDSA